MKKSCVFCGKKPENKNKEHIIPQWLMEMTGTKEKKMSVGSNMKTGNEFVFNFKAFTFPACKACNDNYGKLESKIKPIVEKILIDEFIEQPELILLLDWFDKVRIGLLIGVNYMNNKNFDLEPKYFINQRIGLKDRFLAITNCYDGKKELRWTGVNSLLFLSSPTTFTLKINNILFTNCSSDFIVSKQLGFPYPEFFKPKKHESSEIDILLNNGKQRLSTNLFKSKIYLSSILIAQPIFKVGKDKFPEKYNNNYIKKSSISHKNGVGKIFVYEKNDQYILESDEVISFYSDDKNKKEYKFNAPTIKFQIEVFNYIKYYLNHLDKDVRKQHLAAKKYIIDSSLEQIQHYDY